MASITESSKTILSYDDFILTKGLIKGILGLFVLLGRISMIWGCSGTGSLLFAVGYR